MILIGKHTKHQSDTPYYEHMFQGCESLTSAPKIFATTDSIVMSCDSEDTLIKKQNTYANNAVVYCRDTGKLYVNIYGKFEELSMIE